jgi:hypothetical protein
MEWKSALVVRGGMRFEFTKSCLYQPTYRFFVLELASPQKLLVPQSPRPYTVVPTRWITESGKDMLVLLAAVNLEQCCQ